MKKYVLDWKVSSGEQVNDKNVLIRLTDDKPLPEMLPGQFVEVRVDGSPSTFLRRPISINFIDRERNELWLLVATIGDGTRTLGRLHIGDKLNCILPLLHLVVLANVSCLLAVVLELLLCFILVKP